MPALHDASSDGLSACRPDSASEARRLAHGADRELVLVSADGRLVPVLHGLREESGEQHFEVANPDARFSTDADVNDVVVELRECGRLESDIAEAEVAGSVEGVPVERAGLEVAVA